MIDAAKKLNVMIDRRSKVEFGLLLLPMLFVALLEMVSLGMVLPVIQIVLFGGEGGAFADLIRPIFPADGNSAARSLSVSIAFCVLFATKSVLLFGMIFLINRTVYRKVTRFSADLFNLYLHRPLRFHLERNSAEIIRNLMSGASLTFESIRHVLLIALESLLMVSAIVLLFLVEPRITLLLAGALLVIASLFYFFISPVFRHWGMRQQTLEGDMIKWIVQAFSSIRDIKMFNSYGFLDHGIREIVRQRARYQTYSVSTMHVPRLAMETVVVVGFMVFVGLLSASETPREEIVATLGVFGMAAIRILPSLNRILSSGAELRQRSAYIDTLYQDWIDGHRDREQDDTSLPSRAIGLSERIDLKDVRFAYSKEDEPALKGINLAIQKGQSIGIVGPSGGGKSTLIDIILGLLKPDGGEVTVDGADIMADISAWRGSIGFVPQQIYLLDDSIRRNIAFGLQDTEIEEARIAESVSLAYLDDVVGALPEGLDTIIGEQGTRLSGGQRQRIAIARALYRGPDVLVFDEATSALDALSEAEITRAVEKLSGDRTVLIIAHRLSTIKNCDVIAFVKDGMIVDQGSFDELCARDAEFANLARVGAAPSAGAGK